ncbi:MAG: Ig-like domain-containing protein, partial [Anaerovoracaceae bacterium]
GDYRVKANFTRSELEALGTAEYRYSNITSFGTVMEIVARGVTVTEILSAAGIDPGSVETLNFRTTDGTQVNNWFVSLSMGKWVYGNRYYYPNLRGNYQTQEQQVLPGEGALSGAISVPSILAIESCETKSPTAVIDGTMMDTESSYRFCAGQGPLSEGIPSSDVTSNNSAQWIYGIDVTLRGSPGEATGVSLKIDDPNVKVGSQKKITAIIQGHELFEDKVNGTLTWSSSDESIATVDGEGNVTVHKEGAVTITATTENGISRSVTINGVGQMPGDKESIKDSGGESGAMGVALSQGEPRDIEAQDSKEKRNAN